MGRVKANKGRRIRPQDVNTMDELYAGLNQVAEDALEKLSAALCEAGATPEQVRAYHDAVRAQTAMQVLSRDWLAMWEQRPDDTIQQVIFDNLMGLDVEDALMKTALALETGLPEKS